LIAFQSARLPARVDHDGEIVLLEDQDRRAWDPRLIALGFSHLEKSAEGNAVTAYHLQAAIAGVHAGAPSAAETPWNLILGFYDDLVALERSPLVCLNRVVAVWKVHGVAAALGELTALEREPSLANYYLLPAVKGRLLATSGDPEGAHRAFEAAMHLSCSAPERRLLQRLAQRIRRDSGSRAE